MLGQTLYTIKLVPLTLVAFVDMFCTSVHLFNMTVQMALILKAVCTHRTLAGEIHQLRVYRNVLLYQLELRERFLTALTGVGRRVRLHVKFQQARPLKRAITKLAGVIYVQHMQAFVHFKVVRQDEAFLTMFTLQILFLAMFRFFGSNTLAFSWGLYFRTFRWIIFFKCLTK